MDPSTLTSVSSSFLCATNTVSAQTLQWDAKILLSQKVNLSISLSLSYLVKEKKTWEIFYTLQTSYPQFSLKPPKLLNGIRGFFVLLWYSLYPYLIPQELLTTPS